MVRAQMLEAMLRNLSTGLRFVSATFSSDSLRRMGVDLRQRVVKNLQARKGDLNRHSILSELAATYLVNDKLASVALPSRLSIVSKVQRFSGMSEVIVQHDGSVLPTADKLLAMLSFTYQSLIFTMKPVSTPEDRGWGDFRMPENGKGLSVSSPARLRRSQAIDVVVLG